MNSICILALSYLASLTSVTRADVTFGIASQVTTGNHLTYSSNVQEPYDECGESSCPACTAYKSCVGPMVQTDQQTLNAGDCILWEYSTTGGSDAFEAFVGVFTSTGSLSLLQVSRGGSCAWLLGEVATAAGGGGTVLLSLAELAGKAAGSLQSDNVLADDGSRLRRLDASALRSQPLSINFRRTDGSKIDVTNLQEPMKIVLQVDDPNATCAFWDTELAKWSSEGVETLPSETPGMLVCATRHLSIFGGVVSVVLRNVVVALECSTFSTLMDAAAFEKLGQTDWHQQSAGVLSICILVFLVLALCITVRADRQTLKHIPWDATEAMLMRVKEAPKRKEVPKEESKEESKESEEEQGDGTTKKNEKRKSEKENAAGGDWELPSIFRTMRGLVEASLDTVNQATGGGNFVEEIKEVVSNAETGTINRSIGMIQSHRSGACQATIKVVQTGVDETHTGPITGEVSPEVGGRRSNPASRARATIRASIREIVEVAGRVRFSGLAKVNALHGNAIENGTGAATSFLERGYFCRLALLLPAVHNWLKLRQMSVLIPYSVRAMLIGMKVISAEALCALFFSSSAPTPDSDPKCNPPSDDFERLVQSVTVGFVTAFLGDGIIFLLYLVQRKKVLHKPEWTEALIARQRFWWSFRTRAFWVISICYIIFCKMYAWLFLANVRKVDASKWADSVLWTLFQDLILKPLCVAVILTTMSSLLLCCRPSLKRKIEAHWKDVDEDEDLEDQNRSEAGSEESHVSHVISGASSIPEVEEEAPPTVVIDRRTSKDSQMDFVGILPGAMPS
eukprot:symbB.v1.2.032758.t2/scaffold3973.1/size47119/1